MASQGVQPRPQGRHRLGGGMVGDLEPHPRVLPPEPAQHRQQKPVEGDLAGPHRDGPALQAAPPRQLGLGGLKLFLHDLDVGKQFFPLRRQAHPPMGPLEQTALQLPLQRVDGPGYIGLVALEGRRRPGQAPIFGDIIEDPVVVVGNGHGLPPFDR